MPELPSITIYCERLTEMVVGHTLEKIQLFNPFILRTVEPAPADAEGHAVTSVHSIGKRVVLGFDNDIFMVVHLMIAGRFRWRGPDGKIPKKLTLAQLDFPSAGGILILTEAGTKRRASIHFVRGREALIPFDRGGIEVLDCRLEDFKAALTKTNHTLKRAMTDPRILSGIGNAYSDEILHRARLSPVKWTTRLDDDEFARLHSCTTEVLEEWIARHREDAKGGFPEKVTAFHDAMAVHGRHKKPCPVCNTAIQRIRYASNETNYCPRCQTDGKLLADRSLSRLMKKDWPKTIEELEGR